MLVLIVAVDVQDVANPNVPPLVHCYYLKIQKKKKKRERMQLLTAAVVVAVAVQRKRRRTLLVMEEARSGMFPIIYLLSGICSEV